MSIASPVGGRLLTLPFVGLGVVALIGMFFLGQRFVLGLGAVTNLNGGYGWGLWVVYDIVVGTALACGGYALALTVYVLNRGEYHPLVRPAVTASLLGYALGAFSAFFDMGRYWKAYNVFWPPQWNRNSVMLEVALCVTSYVVVLAIEFAPALFERLGWQGLRRTLEKWLFVIIAVGILLPTMHQSSLGSLLIAMGHKVHPLWQSLQLQPLLALLSALVMGFSVVIFESSLSASGLNRPSEASLLARLGRFALGLLAAFLLVRVAELLARNKLGYVVAGDLEAAMFLLETALFAGPLVVLALPGLRQNGRLLLFAALSMLLAGALYRFNAFLIAFNPGPGFSYFPSVPELMVTLGIIAIEVMAYLAFVKLLPILPGSAHGRSVGQH
jgi:Ni/Fe-hydrogenase subunit HybB-like protein